MSGSPLENSAARVVLKPGRERSAVNRHPWIFSGAVQRIEGSWAPGDVVTVIAHGGTVLGKGFINPHSQIRVRLLSYGSQPVDRALLERRIEVAARLRTRLLPPRTSALRLVNADADLLPGLVVDRYDQVLVMQLHALGMSRLRSHIVDILRERFAPSAIMERSESPALVEEGLAPFTHVLFGTVPERIEIAEHGVRCWVDVLSGQKTGTFLDQRDNRERIAHLAAGKALLNCFSYTGGFSLHAALRGAVTTSVEVSEPAQALARESFVLNGMDPAHHRFVVADAFDFLRQTPERFDVIVLDPPAFVKRRAHQDRGARAYKDINRLAMGLLRHQGLLLSCSCSQHVDWDLFQKILFSAAQEAGRHVQVVGRFGQPPDHPFSVFHPQGEYLKTFLLAVTD